jgi:Rps23 Pro-64 3,4-dihydroxylase Tpa1-like proline 4-hydroxylase
MPSVPHVLIDDFLPAELHAALLAHVLAVEDFVPARTIANGKLDYNHAHRRGKLSEDRLGPHLAAFRAALQGAFKTIPGQLGMVPFKSAAIEIRLAAHGDGDFFKPHRDTFVGAERALSRHDRLVTAVYYIHGQPRRFVGGELLLYPFDRSAPLEIEPCDNCLVAFPSFLLHEVKPVSNPTGEWSNSRFSVSCWFDRERPAEQPPSGTAPAIGQNSEPG